MPIHKNVPRNGSVRMSFSGTFLPNMWNGNIQGPTIQLVRDLYDDATSTNSSPYEFIQVVTGDNPQFVPTSGVSLHVTGGTGDPNATQMRDTVINSLNANTTFVNPQNGNISVSAQGTYASDGASDIIFSPTGDHRFQVLHPTSTALVQDTYLPIPINRWFIRSSDSGIPDSQQAINYMNYDNVTGEVLIIAQSTVAADAFSQQWSVGDRVGMSDTPASDVGFIIGTALDVSRSWISEVKVIRPSQLPGFEGAPEMILIADEGFSRTFLEAVVVAAAGANLAHGNLSFNQFGVLDVAQFDRGILGRADEVNGIDVATGNGTIHRPSNTTVTFSVLNAVSTDDQDSYVMEGVVTKEDWLGDVLGNVEQVDVVDLEFASNPTFGGASTVLQDFTGGILVPGQPSFVELTFQHELNPAFTVPRVDMVANQVRVRLSFNQVTLNLTDKVRVWTNALNAAAEAGTINITCLFVNEAEAEAGLGLPTIRVFNSIFTDSINSEVNIDAQRNTFGVTATLLTVDGMGAREGVPLSFADDPNRELIGTAIAPLGVRVFGTAVRAQDTVAGTFVGQLPMIQFSTGSTLQLDDGFILDISNGYDFYGDGKDIDVAIKDGATLLFTGEQRDLLWGTKSFWNQGTNVTGDLFPLERTAANPFNVSIFNGGRIHIGSSNVPHVFSPLRRNRPMGAPIDYFSVAQDSLSFNTRDANFLISQPNGSAVTQIYRNGTGGIDTPVSFTLAQPDTAIILMDVGPQYKHFSPATVTQTSGRLLFTSDRGTEDDTSYNTGIYVGGNYNFDGDLRTSDNNLFGNNPNNLNFRMFDMRVNGDLYIGPWGWEEDVSAIKGTVRLARLWNPSWEYQSTGLSDIRESYYYGSNTDATLTTVKELTETREVGIPGTQQHPFESGVTISSTEGLADAFISGDQSNYKSNNTGNQQTGWGDLTNDYDGVALSYLVGADFDQIIYPLRDADGADITSWFSYTRRNGFRPYFATRTWVDSTESYINNMVMDGSLDPYWQSTDPAILAGKGASFIDSISIDANAKATVTLLTDTSAQNYNDIYQGIESVFNSLDADLVDAPTPASGINPQFIRLIDDVPITDDGDINISGYDLEFHTDGHVLSPGVGTSVVNGIDADTNNIEIIHGQGFDVTLLTAATDFISLNITTEQAQAIQDSTSSYVKGQVIRIRVDQLRLFVDDVVQTLEIQDGGLTDDDYIAIITAERLAINLFLDGTQFPSGATYRIQTSSDPTVLGGNLRGNIVNIGLDYVFADSLYAESRTSTSTDVVTVFSPLNAGTVKMTGGTLQLSEMTGGNVEGPTFAWNVITPPTGGTFTLASEGTVTSASGVTLNRSTMTSETSVSDITAMDNSILNVTNGGISGTSLFIDSFSSVTQEVTGLTTSGGGTTSGTVGADCDFRDSAVNTGAITGGVSTRCTWSDLPIGNIQNHDFFNDSAQALTVGTTTFDQFCSGSINFTRGPDQTYYNGGSILSYTAPATTASVITNGIREIIDTGVIQIWLDSVMIATTTVANATAGGSADRYRVGINEGGIVVGSADIESALLIVEEITITDSATQYRQSTVGASSSAIRALGYERINRRFIVTDAATNLSVSKDPDDNTNGTIGIILTATTITINVDVSLGTIVIARLNNDQTVDYTTPFVEQTSTQTGTSTFTLIVGQDVLVGDSYRFIAGAEFAVTTATDFITTTTSQTINVAAAPPLGSLGTIAPELIANRSITLTAPSAESATVGSGLTMTFAGNTIEFLNRAAVNFLLSEQAGSLPVLRSTAYNNFVFPFVFFYADLTLFDQSVRLGSGDLLSGFMGSAAVLNGRQAEQKVSGASFSLERDARLGTDANYVPIFNEGTELPYFPVELADLTIVTDNSDLTAVREDVSKASLLIPTGFPFT